MLLSFQVSLLFLNQFQSQKDALLSNWTAGANREQAVKNFCNDEYIIQTMHDYMFDAMNDVVKDYLSNKE